MSNEVTPESLRAHATWLNDRGAKESHMALTRWADDLERESKPLPTVPGWYPNIVVERGGESCTGALLTAEDCWSTPTKVDDWVWHGSANPVVTVRWAEQDGTTPGQTLWEADRSHCATWRTADPEARSCSERLAAAVLAAHGTPTLTPVGEHPEPGTRGLLPVVFDRGAWRRDVHGVALMFGRSPSDIILADPRPDGAHE